MNEKIALPSTELDSNLISGEIAQKSHKDLWEKIGMVLKSHMSIESFELWVKPIVPVSLLPDENQTERQIFSIEVPNKIFSEWIQQNAAEEIQLILKQLVGTDIALSILVRQDAPAASTQRTSFVDIPAPLMEALLPPIDTLNLKYTFETFIEGQTNRFAKAAAEGVAKEPGIRFNPLFIYGGVGLGKTHLMHAISHAIRQNYPKARVLYTSSEKFMNEFINSLRMDRPADFRNKYRNLDCLLIDDIQFLMDKGRSVEEFFFTFNTLFDSRKQIVISSDRAPKEMGSLQDRLVSRFEWGVVADVQPPELETRIAILRKKAELDKIFVPEDVLLFIASQVKSNIRELEGALTRIVAYASLTATPLTVDSARATLKDILKKEELEAPIMMEAIQEVVAKNFNLDVKELKSKRRTDAIAWPRQVAMYLARNLTELSTPEIGEQFGGKDHTTVLHACEKVKLKLAESPFVSSLINKIIQEIKNENSKHC
jgi:chromosomal replication initiator protein